MASSEQFKTNNIKINSLILTKKSGNDYNGVLTTSEPNGKFSYTVDVTYDGDNFTWKIVTPENIPAATQNNTPQTNYEVPKLSCEYCAKQFPQYEAVNDDVRGTVFCSQNCYKSYLFQLANP
jgi:hypothetical protein